MRRPAAAHSEVLAQGQSGLAPRALDLSVPWELARKINWLSDEARRLPTHLMAGSGSGKSRGWGRGPAFFDLLRGQPQVILDPTGGTIDNLIDRIILLAPEVQAQLWPRILYVDLGASDYVVPMPLYYRLSEHDTLFAVANRLLDVIERLDPALTSASIEGMNAIREVGTYAGMVAVALGGQITEVVDLIHHPKAWMAPLLAARARYPELQPAVDYLQEYSQAKPEIQRRRSASFLNQLIPFLADPALQAMFASSRRGVDMQRVDAEGLTLLVDGRHEHNPRRRQFKLLWCFRLVTDYLKLRGMAGRERLIALFIDEVTQLLGFASAQSAVMAEDLEELISVLARNYGCMLTIAHQSLAQIQSDRIRAALMAMGNQIIGVIHNPDDRLYLARYFLRYDPYAVKKREPVWMSVQQGIGHLSYSEPAIIDYTTEEFTPEEQIIEAAERFRALNRFCFLMRPAIAEGSFAQRLYEVTTEHIDRGRYPDEEQVAEARRQLGERDGTAVATLLAEIERRRQAAITVTPAKLATAHAILEGDVTHDHPSRPVPAQNANNRRDDKRRGRPAKQPSAPPAAGDTAWQESLWQDIK